MRLDLEPYGRRDVESSSCKVSSEKKKERRASAEVRKMLAVLHGDEKTLSCSRKRKGKTGRDGTRGGLENGRKGGQKEGRPLGDTNKKGEKKDVRERLK